MPPGPAVGAANLNDAGKRQEGAADPAVRAPEAAEAGPEAGYG